LSQNYYYFLVNPPTASLEANLYWWIMNLALFDEHHCLRALWFWLSKCSLGTWGSDLIHFLFFFFFFFTINQSQNLPPLPPSQMKIENKRAPFFSIHSWGRQVFLCRSEYSLFFSSTTNYHHPSSWGVIIILSLSSTTTSSNSSIVTSKKWITKTTSRSRRCIHLCQMVRAECFTQRHPGTNPSIPPECMLSLNHSQFPSSRWPHPCHHYHYHWHLHKRCSPIRPWPCVVSRSGTRTP